jgi:hypothetical protein
VISGNLPLHAHPVPKDGETLFMPPHPHPEVHTGFLLAGFMDQYSTRPASDLITDTTPESPFSPLPMVPIQGDSTSSGSWAGVNFLDPYAPAQSLRYATYPFQEVPAEEVDVGPDTYDHRLHSTVCPVHKTHNCEHPAHRIRGHTTCERKFTCEQCSKGFSGKWEMDRHVKSIHGPATIGCRRCNYKQSRKDLFSEHCKKRHPEERIEDLMHHLSTEGA